MKLEVLEIRKDKIQQFNKKDIYSIEDLLKFIPKKYYDFRQSKAFDAISDGDMAAVVLTLKSVEELTSSNGRKYVNVEGRDDSGHYYTVLYFNSTFMIRKLHTGDRVAFCGKANVKIYNNKRYVSFINPVVTEHKIEKAMRIKPVYRKIQGMSDSFFDDCMERSLSFFNFDEYLETSVVSKFQLVHPKEMYFGLHLPKKAEDIKKAKKRLVFDDLFFFNYMIERKVQSDKLNSDFYLKKGEYVRKYFKNLPFQLTEGQIEALKVMLKKASEGKRVNTLVQGDVGCGKTEVAKIMLLSAVDGGSQAVLLAPTVILARQHYEDCLRSMECTGVRIAFISSELKKSEKNKLIKQIKNHEVDIVIGTHSVLNACYEFDKLGLVVVDEEHRFGVKQRETLVERLKNGVHSISMSATPIPRTLALSMYGDNIDICEIKSLPKGKKPIQTKKITDEFKTLEELKKAIEQGDQAYVVCPLVDEGEDDGVADINTVYRDMCNYLYSSNVRIGMVSGKMKESEVKETITKFQNHELDVLISTTVIEVGVNVPNATIIWIKNAERFGIAQLHQLRGRVGRGTKQGYCWLEGDAVSENSQKKMDFLCESNDGFYLAQKDLEMRGSGDFLGTVQTGNNKYISLMLSYPEFNKAVKAEVKEIFKDEKRRIFYEERIANQIKELFEDQL